MPKRGTSLEAPKRDIRERTRTRRRRQQKHEIDQTRVATTACTDDEDTTCVPGCSSFARNSEPILSSCLN